MRQKNSLGHPVIFEPVQTADVDISATDFASPHRYGGKVKCKSTGTLKVHYVGDANDVKRDLVVQETEVWLSDRIDIVYKTGTDITTAGDLIFGW
jgi:hypothetical protein